MCSMRVCMCVVGGCVCVQQVPLDEPLVSQVAGRAVGFLTVTTEMDLSVLDKCFDLEPFHHLRKALPGKGHIPTPTITTPTTPHPLHHTHYHHTHYHHTHYHLLSPHPLSPHPLQGTTYSPFETKW